MAVATAVPDMQSARIGEILSIAVTDCMEKGSDRFDSIVAISNGPVPARPRGNFDEFAGSIA